MSRPWWWPVKTDEAWLARVRDDYPENAHLSDEELREEYADGAKYQTLWDHTADAYEEYEKLADFVLDSEAEHFRDMLDCQERMVNLLAPLRELCDSLNVVNPNRRMVRALRAARAAIATEEKETPNG